jgi:hypothetical protein
VERKRRRENLREILSVMRASSGSGAVDDSTDRDIAFSSEVGTGSREENASQ